MLSRRHLLLFILWTGVTVPLGAFLVFLQDLQEGAEKCCTINLKIPVFILLTAQWMGTNLFEVGKLDELHRHFRVLQLHSFAHAGLGVCGGQTDERLQCSGCYRGSLEGTTNNTNDTSFTFQAMTRRDIVKSSLNDEVYHCDKLENVVFVKARGLSLEILKKKQQHLVVASETAVLSHAPSIGACKRTTVACTVKHGYIL